MKTLFDPTLAEATRQRILSLHAESPRQWGTMTVAQTLAHCTAGAQMAMGILNPQRAPFPGSLLGKVIKPLVLGNDTPMRRNAPSSPVLFPAEPDRCDLERERTALIAALDRFAREGAACCTQHPHPFFGRMTPQEWAILMYKHLDHHLRQFGA